MACKLYIENSRYTHHIHQSKKYDYENDFL